MPVKVIAEGKRKEKKRVGKEEEKKALHRIKPGFTALKWPGENAESIFP